MKYVERIYYTLGDWVSIPMERFDWGWLHPLYSYLMMKSYHIDEKYDLGQWTANEQID